MYWLQTCLLKTTAAKSRRMVLKNLARFGLKAHEPERSKYFLPTVYGTDLIGDLAYLLFVARHHQSRTFVILRKNLFFKWRRWLFITHLLFRIKNKCAENKHPIKRIDAPLKHVRYLYRIDVLRRELNILFLRKTFSRRSNGVKITRDGTRDFSHARV